MATTSRSRSRFRSPAARRRAGRTMIGVAVVGVVVAVAGTVVAWQLLGRLNAATVESLDVTIEATESIEDTIVLADGVLGSTTDALDDVEAALVAVGDSFAAGSAVVEDVDAVAARVAPALGDATTTLRRLERIGGTVDGLLAGLSAIPFGPDYEPEAGLGVTLGRLADDIEPLAGSFEDASASLDGLTVSLDELEAEVDALVGSVGAVNTELAASDELVGRYRFNVGRARAVALAAREDLDRQVDVMRLLLVLAGANLLVGQIVPFWVGRELVERSRAEAPSEPAEV